jgi:hypothetical protein
MATDIYHSALAYFIANQDELCEKYSGKELLMTGIVFRGSKKCLMK